MKPEPIYGLIGERLRVLREMRGESQADFGKALHWTRAAVSLMELGAIRIQVHSLVLAARHFGVDVGRLIGDDGRTRPRRTPKGDTPNGR